MRRLGLVIGLALLGACGEMPRPFQPDGGAGAGPLAAPQEALVVRVELVDGPPVPLARMLSSAVADSLAARGVPAVARPRGNSRYVVRGDARSNPLYPEEPHLALIEWRLENGEGDVVGLFTVGATGSPLQWEYGDPRLVREIGAETASAIAAMIADDKEEEAPAVVAGLFVGGVSGAPGDGNQALERAIRLALQGAKVPLAVSAEKAAHRVEGRVTLSPAGTGQQRIRIVWTVTASDGRPLGRLVQENAIPAGSLDGTWGQTAVVIAAAVADDIEQTVRNGGGRP